VLTRDLDATVRAWYDRYRFGPWKLYTYDEPKISARVEGEPVSFGMRVGFCNIGAVRIEVIQPLDERSPYAASLREHGDANHVHHMRFEVDDHDGARDHMLGLGHEKLLEGEFAGEVPGKGSTAIYFDTQDELGFLLEIANFPEGFVRLEPDAEYP
jgi:methylmalonyl-CoA/ethylmalonyl-CoA epimerase